MSDATERLIEALMQAGAGGAQGAVGGLPLELFRPGVPTPYGRDLQQMQDQGAVLGAAQTQYAHDRPIQMFRPGIPNPTWGWGR